MTPPISVRMLRAVSTFTMIGAIAPLAFSALAVFQMASLFDGVIGWLNRD